LNISHYFVAMRFSPLTQSVRMERANKHASKLAKAGDQTREENLQQEQEVETGALQDQDKASASNVEISQGSYSYMDRGVDFSEDSFVCYSRPINTSESWAVYHFETHARKCVYCHNPYEVYRSHERLCDEGYRLA
jgi:hypothetical protein